MQQHKPILAAFLRWLLLWASWTLCKCSLAWPSSFGGDLKCHMSFGIAQQMQQRFGKRSKDRMMLNEQDPRACFERSLWGFASTRSRLLCVSRMRRWSFISPPMYFMLCLLVDSTCAVACDCKDIVASECNFMRNRPIHAKVLWDTVGLDPCLMSHNFLVSFIAGLTACD